MNHQYLRFKRLDGFETEVLIKNFRYLREIDFDKVNDIDRDLKFYPYRGMVTVDGCGTAFINNVFQYPSKKQEILWKEYFNKILIHKIKKCANREFKINPKCVIIIVSLDCLEIANIFESSFKLAMDLVEYSPKDKEILGI